MQPTAATNMRGQACPLRQLSISFDGGRSGWWRAADAEIVGRRVPGSCIALNNEFWKTN